MNGQAFRTSVFSALSVAMGLAFSAFSANAAAEPYHFDDIRLGASFARVAHDLDFRDIDVAIAQQKTRDAEKPDLGRRGYGCARREDAFADVACVSHEERVSGVETREIRLHFLGGILQQFSITAEIRHLDTIAQAISERHGPPQRAQPASTDGYPSSRWRNDYSSITLYGGKDLVFVSYELSGYAEAVKRKQGGVPSLECR